METIREKYNLEPFEPKKGEVYQITNDYRSGIRKILNYVIGSENKHAWLFIQDDLTSDFVVDIPPKDEMPIGNDGKPLTPYYFIDHCMLWSQRVGNRHLYA